MQVTNLVLKLAPFFQGIRFAVLITLLLTKRSDVQEHVPGFLLGKDQRNEQSAMSVPWTSMFKNPQQFSIGSCFLPYFVCEVPWKFADKSWYVA